MSPEYEAVMAEAGRQGLLDRYVALDRDTQEYLESVERDARELDFEGLLVQYLNAVELAVLLGRMVGWNRQEKQQIVKNVKSDG